ncbi:ATP-binding protein [Thermomonospora amylolytica]|uniref:ATP-binding protein n=1 Tax=Thermomonospora amylolytica TaxID=1411117 RepID=UPI000E6D2951|nr:LuxR C-terminal-related transcriptional regulator [Thermomonospora amylolytica]
MLARGRLLTLLGPVGIGKTRLAIEAAHRSFGRGPEVLFVDLGAVNGPGPAVRTRLDAIAAALRDHRALLLLDGCEHAVEACSAMVERLLCGSHHIRVLATSQQPLDVPGEISFSVGPMSLPPATGTPAELLRSDAVRLFVDRAREQAPGFRLSPANGTAVAEICARLDGMPLAIELAARWVRLLPMAELSARLDDRFSLLTLTPRGSVQHRGLWAAIDKSMRLLDEHERSVLRRLSVFAGGFGLAGATGVCADGAVPDMSVLKTISALEAKSVVTLAGRTAGAARFTQLESIRLYGLQQLQAAGELEVFLDRLVDWLTSSLESRTEQVFLAPDALRMLDDEHANLAVAAERAAAGDDDRRLVLAAALARWRWERGDTSGARALLDSVAGRRGADPRYRSAALREIAWLRCWEGEPGTAIGPAEEAMRIERRLDRPHVHGETLRLLGLVHLTRDDYALALSRLEEAVSLVRPLGHPRGAAGCLHDLAYATFLAGDPRRATEVLDEAISIADDAAEPALLAAALHTAGVLELSRGNAQGARARFVDSLRAHRAGHPGRYAIPRALEGLAIAAVHDDRPHRALRLVAVATAIRPGRAEPDPSWRRSVLHAVEAARRVLGPSRASQAEKAGRGLSAENVSPEDVIAYALDDTWPERGAEPEHHITTREREVARLVAVGLTNRQIADRLGVSPRTVDSHLQHIRDKLGLRSRTQVAVWAAQRPAQPSAPQVMTARRT